MTIENMKWVACVAIVAILGIVAIEYAEAAKTLKTNEVAQINYNKVDYLNKGKTQTATVMIHKFTDTESGATCYVAASDEPGFSGQSISCVK